MNARARVRRLAGRRWMPAACWSLAGLTVLVLAAALTLAGLDSGRLSADRLGFNAVLAAAVLLYAGTSRLITSRVPGNAIGWLLGLIGLLLAAEMLTEQYPLYGLVTAPGSLPAAKVVGWFSMVLAVVAIFLLFFLVLLFPDGRLPSRRWRPVPAAIFVLAAASVVSQMRAGTSIQGGLGGVLAAAGASYPNPLGIFARYGWFGAFDAATLGLAILAGALAVASVFVRLRGAGAERRKQIAWLGYIGLITAGWLGLLLVAGAVNGADGWIGSLLWILLVLTPVAGIPLACTVAVLKYRLYEIDRIISRTVAYAIVTGLLVGLYTGLVLLATRVLPLRGPVAVAGSTLAAAALFSPLRRRVQEVVDRRFNRARYDADRTLAAFADRLKDAVDLESVRDDLAGVAYHALEPAHVTVWVRPQDRPAPPSASPIP